MAGIAQNSLCDVSCVGAVHNLPIFRTSRIRMVEHAALDNVSVSSGRTSGGDGQGSRGEGRGAPLVGEEAMPGGWPSG